MLNIDLFFHAAIESNQYLVSALGGRIFNTARPDIDEEQDKIPYVIVTYEGGSATDDDKDEYIAPLGSATVSILVVASDRQSLASLTHDIHDVIVGALEDENFQEGFDWEFEIDSCTPSAGAVQYDSSKPCYFQTLTYQCDQSV